MSWKDIIKEDYKRVVISDRDYNNLSPEVRAENDKRKMRSIAKDMENLFRGTDWRTVMSDEIVDLDKRIDTMSREEIENLRDLKHRLFTPQMQKYEEMVDKLLELKEK